MIWRCVDDDKLMDETLSLATHLATQPTKAFSLIKRAMLASATNTLEQQLELEKELQCIAGKTRDFQEGVQAFLEKRKPKFEGN